MAHLPRINQLDASSNGCGFFLCSRKELRTGKTGSNFLAVTLQDASGEIRAKVFQDVDTITQEFSAGEFVKAQGRGSVYNQQLELVVEKIRRVMPDRDAAEGFREDECIRCAPRPLDEMWAELLARIASVGDANIRELLTRIVSANAERLRIWPAARAVHHAYRSGLLEHVLTLIEIGSYLAERYGARRDLVVAGAILHDIGKLEELSYDFAADYTVPGNLLGHITIGAGMVRDAIREIPGFPPTLAIEVEHLILSHHGAKELGSPVEPMTVEAFILAAVDDLDAKLQQIRQFIADDGSDGPFTAYHRRL